MLQLSLSTSLMPPTAPGAGPNPASSGAFALALADALSPIEAPAASGGKIVLAGDPRQAPADDGKILPADAAQGADGADPALAWLAFAAPAVVPTTEAQEPSPETAAPSGAPVPVAATDTVLPQTANQAAPGKRFVESATTLTTTKVSSPAPAVAPDQPMVSGEPVEPKKRKATGDTVPRSSAVIAPAGTVPVAAPAEPVTMTVPSRPLAAPPAANHRRVGHTRDQQDRSASRHKTARAANAVPPSGAAAAIIAAAALPSVNTPGGTAAPASVAAPIAAPVTSATRAIPIRIPLSIAETVASPAASSAPIEAGRPSNAAGLQTRAPMSAVAAPTNTGASNAPIFPMAKQDATDPLSAGDAMPGPRPAPSIVVAASPVAPREAGIDVSLPQAQPAAHQSQPSAPAAAIATVAGDASPGTAPAMITPGTAAAAPQIAITAPPLTAVKSSAMPSGERSAAPAAAVASPAPSAQPATPAPTVRAPQPATPTPAQPAGVVFGIALSAVVAADQRPALDDKPSPRDAALQALTAAAGSAQPLAMVAAAGGAQHGALDMRHDDWPQAMIDRIEALRDAADANNTSIRLVPDALGKVDVSIRHDGDAVHVHFAAETPQTRQLLADAQPRLADAAQARGLRLAQTSVDAGSTGAGAQQQQQQGSAMPQPSSSIRPAQMPAAAAHDSAATPDSTRLA